ncbi:hypothetical protein [Robertkochia solimangrovi]|uniref:hypothetical protein n=1 Tax=Robertkochia solimangrovi TaxID=2213046 RepID=UPI00117C0603|nr:hypothetical protein [Robertkochia solimangrovi]
METKEILQGRNALRDDFQPLADWIQANYEVTPINIYFEVKGENRIPTLEIWFERDRDLEPFQNKFHTFFKSKHVDAIKEQFKALTPHNQGSADTDLHAGLNGKSFPQFDLNELQVEFTAFKPIARISINEQITSDEIESLQKEIDNPVIWKISRGPSGTTFFLYTDDQVRRFMFTKSHMKWTDMYFELLKKYDEFNYFERDNFVIYLDSKENFENNFHGNWFFYYK